MSGFRLRLLITGRVQGVFYRDFTRREAEALAVSGWVRNLPDGRVEAVLEGDEAAVRALVERLEEGPTHARVEQVETLEEKPTGEFDRFSVRG